MTCPQKLRVSRDVHNNLIILCAKLKLVNNHAQRLPQNPLSWHDIRGFGERKCGGEAAFVTGFLDIAPSLLIMTYVLSSIRSVSTLVQLHVMSSTLVCGFNTTYLQSSAEGARVPRRYFIESDEAGVSCSCFVAGRPWAWRRLRHHTPRVT